MSSLPTKADTPKWSAPSSPETVARSLVPESGAYRVKRLLLGRPLENEDLHGERLGKPVALAVLSSDVMSSAAYGTESVLRILIPAAGLGAFALISPITGMLLIVLAVVCMCYRDVVRTYPVSGGSYVVSRENFGRTAAQIPGAALLCSYVLTVAVSIAAGVDAVLSAFPALHITPWVLAVIFVVLLTLGNLRGLKEAGKLFAIPTYWFLVSMGVLFLTAIGRYFADGTIHHTVMPGNHIGLGHEGTGLLLGTAAFIFLRGFANGGSAMTGMEAISNAVTVFKEPQVKNARTTLVLMATILGCLFLGVSVLAAMTHAVPAIGGTPTVLAQMGKEMFGQSAIGQVAYYSLQLSTALILVLGANTSFNGFPLLVSFIAKDRFLPRPFTTRGHRLVYSNGILALASVSVILLIVTKADVARLIPLYATTVFTGFTMAGAGMTRYHMTHPGPGRKVGLWKNGLAFVCSATVTAIFVVTEFTSGAWAVVIVIPLLVLLLSRTHRRYDEENAILAEDSGETQDPAEPGAPGTAGAASDPLSEANRMTRHVVIVLVDRIDLATSRALELARSLAGTDELRAVHFIIDPERAEKLTRAWPKLAHGRAPLEVIDCPDRRLLRAATELAADLASDGKTNVLMVLPRRAYGGFTSRVLHDHTADRIVTAVSRVPGVSATIAPFAVDEVLSSRRRGHRGGGDAAALQGAPGQVPAHGGDHREVARKPVEDEVQEPGVTKIGEVRHRQRVTVRGKVRSVRLQPMAGVPSFACTLVDKTGALTVVFMGRRSVPGVEPGAKLAATGMVGVHEGRLALLNPDYELLAPSPNA